jgi:uncharacterized protein with ATP-grasp and redox domains
MTTLKSPNKKTLPSLPIPKHIRSDVPGTWAHDTTTVRLADIARRTLVENDFAPGIDKRLKELIADIPSAPVRLLEQDGAPDTEAWQEYTRPYLDQNWLEVPWFFIETYFYRRLLEATTYFEPSPGKERDPFAYQKEQGLKSAGAVISAMSERLQAWIGQGFQQSHLSALLAIDLWGNRADLSLWPAGEAEQPSDTDWETMGDHTLVDDTDLVTRYLANNKGGRIDFIVDNAGLELVTDLILADYLLATGAAKTVHLHLKLHPTFVSDAMIKDVQNTAESLSTADDMLTAVFGQRLLQKMADGRIILRDHPFWTSPLAFWEMPQELRQDLAHSTLIISKGDANYRRLLGDRHWPYTTSFQGIMAYAPAPLLALRSLKAELAAGLRREQIERLDQEDPQWMVNGRWGVIQFAP